MIDKKIKNPHPLNTEPIMTWSLLDRTGFAVSRLRELELMQFGLTSEQSSILHILKDYPSLSVKELRDFTMRQIHSTYTIINRMIKMGMVFKKQTARDKGVRIALTKEGKHLLEVVKTDSLEMIFAVLTVQEKRQLRKGLSALLTKARSLLEVSYKPAFLNYLNSGISTGVIIYEDSNKKELNAFELWQLLFRAEFAISRLRELELSQYNLTVEQSSILHIIESSSGSTIKDLENFTMRQHHSIYVLINRMIKMGLATKVRNFQRKSMKIVLTKKGKDLLHKVRYDSLEMIFSVLTIREKEQLIDCLNILLNKARELLQVDSMTI